MYCTVDDVSGKMTPVKYKGPEDAYVEEVRVIGIFQLWFICFLHLILL